MKKTKGVFCYETLCSLIIFSNRCIYSCIKIVSVLVCVVKCFSECMCVHCSLLMEPVHFLLFGYFVLLFICFMFMKS